MANLGERIAFLMNEKEWITTKAKIENCLTQTAIEKIAKIDAEIAEIHREAKIRGAAN